MLLLTFFLILFWFVQLELLNAGEFFGAFLKFIAHLNMASVTCEIGAFEKSSTVFFIVFPPFFSRCVSATMIYGMWLIVEIFISTEKNTELSGVRRSCLRWFILAIKLRAHKLAMRHIAVWQRRAFLPMAFTWFWIQIYARLNVIVIRCISALPLIDSNVYSNAIFMRIFFLGFGSTCIFPTLSLPFTASMCNKNSLALYPSLDAIWRLK